MQRIDRGERILIDGATGTEIECRGVPQIENAWNGGAVLTHPQVVQGVHEDYIRAGAEIVISCTFGTSRHVTRDAGIEDQFEDLSRQAIRLAMQAREKTQALDVLVAGGITHWSWTGNSPSLEELFDNTAEQARLMAETGADLLMLEMMVDIDRLLVCLEAACKSTLPVWVGLSCRVDSDGTVRLLDGDPLHEALLALEDKKVPLINIMHTAVPEIDACLEIVRTRWSGPVGVYAHTGTFVADANWIDKEAISPEAYADNAKRWLARGVQVIGGCCGIGTGHIDALKRIL